MVSGCYVCRNKQVSSSKLIVDWRNSRIRKVSFCYHHSVPTVLAEDTVMDMRDLKRQMESITFKNAIFRDRFMPEYMTDEDVANNPGFFMDSPIPDELYQFPRSVCDGY
jgi:hypothetical protein